MSDANRDLLDRLLEESRAEGGSPREVIDRWLTRGECHAREVSRAFEGSEPSAADKPSLRRMRSRLARARAALHSRLHVAYLLDPANLSHQTWQTRPWADRPRPLEKRGRDASAHRGPFDRLAWERSFHPEGSWTALMHFCGLRGMRPSEAKDFFVALAANYHRNVRALSRVRAHSEPVVYGFGGRVTLTSRTKSGESSRDVWFGGVWPRHISKAERLEDRVLTVAFSLAGRKQVFEAKVPLMCDPESVCMVPTDAPVADDDPDHSQVALRAIAEACGVGLEKVEQGLAEQASGWWLNSFGRTCEHGWRYGRMRARRWSRERGNWLYDNGVWIERIDPESLDVTVALERTMGRIRYQTLTLPHFLGSILSDHYAPLEWRDDRTVVLKTAEPEPSLRVILIDRSDTDVSLYGGKNFVKAVAAKRQAVAST